MQPGGECGNPERKLIWIPAVPSSGTSCVAGILRHLGVSFGKLNRAAWIMGRGYEMWEDPDMRLFGAEFNHTGTKLDVVANRHFRIRDYINYRFINEPHARVGFKGPAHWWADDDEPETLPVEILDVCRPLEDAIQADWRTNQLRPERIEGSPKPTEEEARLRAGALAMCMMAKQQLWKKIEPTYRVRFYELLEEPEPFVLDIIEAFHLEPTDEQIAEAVESVKPKMRHV